MNWFEAALLGLVQGLTEFLPISSSAHLRIVGSFLPNAADPGAAFTAITQLGTETAVDRLLLAGHRADRQGLGRLADAARSPAQRPRCPDGLAGHPRQPAHHRSGPAVPGPDRIGAAQPVDRGHHADRLRPDPRRGRRRGQAGTRPHPADLQARHPLRLCPGHGPHSRRVPLRRHHHRRPPDGLHPRSRGPVLLPAGHPGRVRQRPVPALQGGLQGRHHRPLRPARNGPGHRDRLRCGLRHHRLVPEIRLHRAATGCSSGTGSSWAWRCTCCSVSMSSAPSTRLGL